MGATAGALGVLGMLGNARSPGEGSPFGIIMVVVALMLLVGAAPKDE